MTDLKIQHPKKNSYNDLFNTLYALSLGMVPGQSQPAKILWTPFKGFEMSLESITSGTQLKTWLDQYIDEHPAITEGAVTVPYPTPMSSADKRETYYHFRVELDGVTALIIPLTTASLIKGPKSMISGDDSLVRLLYSAVSESTN